MARKDWSKPQIGEMSRDKIVPSVKRERQVDRALRDSGSLEEARDRIKDVVDKSRKEKN
jgi:hypothetical protein